MPLPPFADFDIQALYSALDAERHSRGMSWQQVTRDMASRFQDVPPRWISPSTLSGMRTKQSIEGDGVLRMLLWLGRTPESFMPGGDSAGSALPEVGSGRILRFDTAAMYAALDAQRKDRGLSWKQVADEIGGFTAASLTRYSKGGRTAFPQVMRIVTWLGRPAASFTRISNW